MAYALWLQGFGVALLTLCLFVGGKQKKETKITISTRKKNEHSMPSSSRVHRTETHTVLRVQPHPFANLAQVPLFPAVSHFLIMDSFVAAVDEAPTTPEVQEAVVAALVDAGFTSPEHLVGTEDSVIWELAGWLAGPAAYSSARSGVPKTCRRPDAQRRRWHPPHSRATWCPKSRAPWLLGRCSASFNQRHQPGQWRAP